MCAGVPQDQLVQCAQNMCFDQVSALSTTCVECITANLAMSIEAIFSTCTSAGGRAGFAYDGSNGLLILSRHPIIEQDHIVFPSYLNRRAAIRAKIDLPSLGITHVVCTHLTPDFPQMPNNGPFGDWKAEQAYQIDRMIAWAESKVTGTERLVITGDMNAGPSIPAAGIDGEVADNYMRFEGKGYTSLYVAGQSNMPKCTFCSAAGGNPYNVGAETLNSVIDHVFMKGAMTYSSKRILDQVIQVMTTTGPEEGRYSDHYGISVEVSK
jgi:endonuclease/exonuclease/phosphatase family metal-dependent hydrolase